ncbi:hypothetical protein AAG906_028767 [Vitis piasezkii]
MCVGTVCAIVNGMIEPFTTIIFSRLLNTFGRTDPSKIQVGIYLTKPSSNFMYVPRDFRYPLIFVYIAIGTGIAAFLQVSSWMITGERQATRIRGLYLKTILRQDIAFFDTETTTGEIIGRMSGDTILIQDAMGEKVGKFIKLMSTFVGGFAIAFARGWLLSLVLLSSIPLLVLTGGAMAIYMAKMWSRGQLAYAEAGNVVASFTGEKKAVEKYARKLEVGYASTVQQGLASGVGLGTVLAIIFEKGYDGGRVINVIISIMTGGMSLGQTSPCLNAFAAGQAAAYKMFEMINRKPPMDPYDTSGTVLADIRGEIELKNVYFKYPARPDVQIFSGFSLSVPSGKTAALVGQSGSGKSTVIILIDGVNLKKFRLGWIREKIGLVSQEPILFVARIKENISYGKKEATDEEIREVIKLANAAKFIDKLPLGIETMVGENGTQLSGGQKQRIAIARAILKNPRILILDEATSVLAQMVPRDVTPIWLNPSKNIMTNRTTVIVAHHLTTIRNADIIAVVYRRKLVEQGTHTELIKDPDGAYSQLVRLQQGNNEAEDQATDTEEEAAKSLNIEYGMSRSSRSRKLSLQDLVSGSSSSWRALSFRYEDAEEKKKVSITRLAYLNRSEIPVLLLGSIAAGVHGVVFPAFGLILSTAIKIFYELPHELRKDSRFWSLMLVGLGAVTLIVASVQNYLFGVAGGKLIQRILSLTFRKVVHQEISWFDDPENSSAVGARLSTDASAVRSLVGDALALVIQNISTIVAGLAISFTANWMLALVILAVLPLVGLQGYLQMKFMEGFSADAKSVASDAVGSIRTVASFCAEKKVMDIGAGFGFSFIALYCTNAFCFYIGAVLVQSGKATFEQVFKVFFALTISAVGISSTSAMGPDTNKGRDAAASIFELLDSKPKIDSSSDEGAILATVRGDIELQHVSFKNVTRPDVQIFRDLCLTIPSGKTVALVGESGSGKSTVISLVDRFYNPDSGRILLDGVELRKFKLSWLRQQMGLVSQEPILFNETIRANIAYGKLGANAHNFISALPHGYETSVGERGLQLSGGQKQRIAIARAILKDPKILLLDEATSALDAESARVVQDALDRVMVERTTVVVAHRLTTIKGADIIAVVKNGVIAEKGRHEVLMKINDGVYASLVSLHMNSSD